MRIKTDMFRLIVTEACNAKCKYCLASMTPKNGQNQSLKAVEKAAKKAKLNGAKEASISGGEPLLDKNIIPKIILVKKYFDKINLQTNGILLTNPKGLKTAGITHVIINLPSYDKETYETLTGVKKYEQVITNVKEAVKEGLNIRINTVLVKNYTEDYAHCLKMIEFSKMLGLKELTFTQLVPANKFAKQHRTDIKITRQLFKRLDQTDNHRYHSADIYTFLDMTIALSSCPFKENEKALQNGWAKEYVLTEDSKLVTDYFHQGKSTMEVLI
ncbi:MAG: radical SAM protein [Nanoarchaeota archaeon]|nr:radical SAM protein [Nanoarchaeota archaeon]